MESNIKNKKQAPQKLISESLDMKRIPAVRAPRISLTEEEVISLMRKEAAVKKKIGNRFDSMLCDNSKASEMNNVKNETEAFDIGKFV